MSAATVAGRAAQRRKSRMVEMGIERPQIRVKLLRVWLPLFALITFAGLVVSAALFLPQFNFWFSDRISGTLIKVFLVFLAAALILFSLVHCGIAQPSKKRKHSTPIRKISTAPAVVVRRLDVVRPAEQQQQEEAEENRRRRLPQQPPKQLQVQPPALQLELQQVQRQEEQTEEQVQRRRRQLPATPCRVGEPQIAALLFSHWIAPLGVAVRIGAEGDAVSLSALPTGAAAIAGAASAVQQGALLRRVDSTRTWRSLEERRGRRLLPISPPYSTQTLYTHRRGVGGLYDVV